MPGFVGTWAGQASRIRIGRCFSFERPCLDAGMSSDALLLVPDDSSRRRALEAMMTMAARHPGNSMCLENHDWVGPLPACDLDSDSQPSSATIRFLYLAATPAKLRYARTLHVRRCGCEVLETQVYRSHRQRHPLAVGTTESWSEQTKVRLHSNRVDDSNSSRAPDGVAMPERHFFPKKKQIKHVAGEK